MKNILTPFGEIKILIDDKAVDYFAQEGRKNKAMYSDVLRRFQIKVLLIPDGKRHTIACIFESNSPYNSEIESGENLECQGFYNEQRIKLSIGVKADVGYIDGLRTSRFDYALKEELDDVNSVVAKFATTEFDVKTYMVEHYNLDMIISVSDRVKSPNDII